MADSDSQNDDHNNRFFDPLIPATARNIYPAEYPAPSTSILPVYLPSERIFAPADVSISDLYVGTVENGKYQRHSVFRVYNALRLRGGMSLIVDKGALNVSEEDCSLDPLVYEPLVDHTEGRAISDLFVLIATAALCLDTYNLLTGSILSAEKVLELVLPIIMVPSNTLAYNIVLTTATIKTLIGNSDDSFIPDLCPIRPNRKDHPLAYFMSTQVRYLLKQTRGNRVTSMRKKAREILMLNKPFCGHSIGRGFALERRDSALKILDILFGLPMGTDENNVDSRRHHVLIDKFSKLYQSSATYDMAVTFLQETIGPELLLASLQRQGHSKLPMSVLAFPTVFLVSELDNICASIHTNAYNVTLVGHQANFSPDEVSNLGKHAHVLNNISPKSPYSELLNATCRRMHYGAGLPPSPA